jgi:hypothetical protein
MCTAIYRPVLSSERVPYIKRQANVRPKRFKNLVIGPKGQPDIKTNWTTFRRSQIQVQLVVMCALLRELLWFSHFELLLLEAVY